MPRCNEIQLRFLRCAEVTIPSTDDVLRIHRLAENSYRIIYTERSPGGGNVDIMTLTNQSLLAYLYRMFWLVGLDEDPFQFVQLFVPGYPTGLIKTADIKTNVPNLLDIIISNCWNWPSAGTDREEVPRTSSHRPPTEDIDE
jgi:hypothetical protein